MIVSFRFINFSVRRCAMMIAVTILFCVVAFEVAFGVFGAFILMKAVVVVNKHQAKLEKLEDEFLWLANESAQELKEVRADIYNAENRLTALECAPKPVVRETMRIVVPPAPPAETKPEPKLEAKPKPIQLEPVKRGLLARAKAYLWA
jgi:hypothetical protein